MWHRVTCERKMNFNSMELEVLVEELKLILLEQRWGIM